MNARLAAMEYWRKNRHALRPLLWSLLCVVLFTTIVPSHYHLHHIQDHDNTPHSHVVDLHILGDTIMHSDGGDSTTILTAAPDSMVKAKYSDGAAPLLVALLLLFTISLSRFRTFFSVFPRSSRIRRHLFYYSPPLRAPPLH